MWSKFLRFTEMVLDSVERGVTFQRLQRDVEDELNELGRLILQWAIEGAMSDFVRMRMSERTG